MLPYHQVIKSYRVTEKSNALSSDLNHYSFEVFPSVNRTEIAYAIEKAFNVTVERVNVLNKQGKLKRNRVRQGVYGRTNRIKKAIVALKKGDKIELV
ncbi:MAG: 50S ribosomal protein L23 [Verrucomicrobia bacterium GWC2_42_7]|nr:MAG: 50S ribosomal protein L23 [Verrucomicrobia bacterium GWC2_42_7]